MSNEKWGVVFASITQGRAVTESGVEFTFAPGCSLLGLLLIAVQHTPVNRVYLVGELPAGYTEWLTSPEMYKFWRTQAIGHMLDGNQADDYVARYEHRKTGRKLDVRAISHWLGEGDYSIYQARGAMLLLTQNLKRKFPFFTHLSGTPSTTFSVLWQQYNAMEHKKFEPLPEQIRNTIRESTGQGRIQYFEENVQGQIPGLYYYDGIFMYAALTWGLPAEVETHDNVNEFAGKQLARYRISFTVPATWKHIGPFGVRDAAGIWHYPDLHNRGQSFETWVDGAELDALISTYSMEIVCIRGASAETVVAANKHAKAQGEQRALAAWKITILERIIYRNAKDCKHANPLDSVVKKLVDIRTKIDEDARQDVKHATVYKLARAGIRNIVLHGIGAFNRQAGTRTYIGLAGELPPAGFVDRNEFDDGRIAYVVPEEARATSMSHPEYPACVWGRCRARMFKHAMAVPYEELVTIRTDAIATKSKMAAWEKGEKVGELRRKWAVEKRLKAPATALDFDILQRKIVGEK